MVLVRRAHNVLQESMGALGARFAPHVDRITCIRQPGRPRACPVQQEALPPVVRPQAVLHVQHVSQALRVTGQAR
jgi:hypothetical protein